MATEGLLQVGLLQPRTLEYPFHSRLTPASENSSDTVERLVSETCLRDLSTRDAKSMFIEEICCQGDFIQHTPIDFELLRSEEKDPLHEAPHPPPTATVQS